MGLEKSVQLPEKPKTFGVRHVQALLMFFGMAFGYFLRINISSAIVPMTKPNANAPYYDWDPTIKSLLLSSFFLGYLVAQIPAAMLAKCFGGRLVLGIATVVCSLLTILHPWAASVGDWQALCVLRVLVGLTQGCLFPTVHTLLAKWTPCTERSSMATMVYPGAQLGTVIILAISGPIINSSMGWPGIFYFSGAVALVWSLLFLYFAADSPQRSKFITKEERDYIEALTGGDPKSELMTVPWKSFFTSAPLYGLIVAQTGCIWGFFTLITEIPTYMDKVLKFNATSNALLSALPYFTSMVLCFVFSPISDMLINRNILSTTKARKLFHTIGQWIPMACLIAMSYMTSEERVAAIILLTIGVGFNAPALSGYLVNHMDLSPNFAGTLMSICNAVANFVTIFAPLVVGAIVKNEEDPAQWRIVFFITAGVYLISSCIFLILGQGKVQPWNDLAKTSALDTSGDIVKIQNTTQTAKDTQSKPL